MHSENQSNRKEIPKGTLSLVAIILIFLLVLIFIWLWYDIQIERLNDKEMQYRKTSFNSVLPSLNPKTDQTL